MPQPSLKELAERFCQFHNSSLCSGDRCTDSLDVPDFLRCDPVKHAASVEARKGERLRWTSEMEFGRAPKAENADTKRLRMELEAKATEKKVKSLQRLADWKIRQAKSKSWLQPLPAKPAAASPPKETVMATVAKKASPKKSAKGKSQPKTGAKRQAKAATAKARTPIAKPAAAGERARFDWAAAEIRAAEGKIVKAPDFSAPTHARFLPILEEIKAAISARDVKALKAIKINPVSSTPKAMDRYRIICVKALQAPGADAKA